MFKGLVLPSHHITEFVSRGIQCPYPYRFSRECIENDLDAIMKFLDKILFPVVGNKPARCLVKTKDQVLYPQQSDTISTGCRSP